MNQRLVLLATFAFLLPSNLLCAAEPDAAQLDFFESKIRPVLVQHCYACHSEEAKTKGKLKAGFLSDTKDAIRKGGETGVSIVPGKPTEGTFLAALNYKGDVQMPPSGKLPEPVIADFAKWIQNGAIDPRDGSKQSASGIDLKKGRNFWAFQAPKIVPANPIKNSSLAPTMIDRYIQAEREKRGIQPVETADRRTLIRRIYFDLIGTPPTPEAVDAFLADNSMDAEAKIIDELLASPQYGERWARYWLDVARYAEDQAHTFAVKPKSQAYRYRDWVIQAFNADMPYDQFIRYQLAGDLLPANSVDLTTRLAGLGFLGLGAEYYKNSAKEQAIADELDDRVDTVTRGFLGLTVSCARCHDHKFDPIPQIDYYSLAGIFNGSNFGDMPLVPEAEVKVFNQAQQGIKDQEAAIKTMLTDAGREKMRPELGRIGDYLKAAWVWNAVGEGKRDLTLDKWAEAKNLNRSILNKLVKVLPANGGNRIPQAIKPLAEIKPKQILLKLQDPLPPEIVTWIDGYASKLNVALQSNSKALDGLLKGLAQEPNTPFGVTPEEIEAKWLDANQKEKLVQMRSELEQRKKTAPAALPVAHVLQGGGQTMKVFIRGNPLKFGEMAPKRFLQVISETATKPEFNRLDLANAIASPDNPLTARVIVNRIWQNHFGKGLVITPSNLGLLGEKPSHPELLDYLAVQFMQHGWSIKWLHREIMRSATYQLSSRANPENARIDGDNQSLWRANRRRLDIEAWRDSLLTVSGSLDPTVGGPTYDLRNPNANRRTVYAKISRHELDGLLRLFDFPDANVTSDRRNSTTVPQQQLFALNSEFMINQAKAFAKRCQAVAGTEQERIQTAYQLAFNREPTSAELSLSTRFLAQANNPEDQLTRWQQYAQALLASNEFLYVD
jgi:mono/diheme cytochrome c family protein